MVVGAAEVRSPVDKFFQFSLLGLLTAGYLAVLGSGFLDLPTIIAVAAALMLRTLLVADLPTIRFAPSVVTAATLAYFGFYPLDYFYVSHSFIPATVHLVFFVAVVKILTASSERDYLYLKIIAFLELLAACVLSYNINFFLFLTLFLLLGVAAFASSEIRRSIQVRPVSAQVSAKMLGVRLTGVVAFISLGILFITGGLFFFLPRTARAAFQHFVSHRYHLAGFSNEVNLSQTGEIQKENTPVMRVQMDKEEDRKLALKWRGAALAEFDGHRWFNSIRAGEPLRPDNTRMLWLVAQNQRFDAPNSRHISYAVQLEDFAADTLFFAGTPEFLRIDSRVVRYDAGNYRLRNPDMQAVAYRVYSRLDPPVPEFGQQRVEPLSETDRERYLQLPQLDERIPALARQLTSDERYSLRQAQALEGYLRTHYGYTLELPQTEPPDPLAYFLFDRKQGHCEYFASSLAVMLRSLRIPARVVTGFQSGIFNPVSGWQVIRTSDAHSWVEAYLPYRGWVTFDPTPPDLSPTRLSLWTRFGFYTDAAEMFWQDWVMNYSRDRQLQLATSLEQSSRKIRGNWLEDLNTNVEFLRKKTIVSLRIGVVVLPLLALLYLSWKHLPKALRWWATRQRLRKAQNGQAQASDATLLYDRMLKLLKHRGIEKPAWITPMEFARMLPEHDLALLVEDLTSAYNALRFGGSADAGSRMTHLLSRLEAFPS